MHIIKNGKSESVSNVYAIKDKVVQSISEIYAVVAGAAIQVWTIAKDYIAGVFSQGFWNNEEGWNNNDSWLNKP